MENSLAFLVCPLSKFDHETGETHHALSVDKERNQAFCDIHGVIYDFNFDPPLHVWKSTNGQLSGQRSAGMKG